MSDKPWKAFERDAAALIGGERKWSNSGERLDVESAEFIGQCKLVQRLSLAELTKLAEEMQREGDKTGKYGAVFTKLRLGKGKKTPMLVTMTDEDFRVLMDDRRQMEQYTRSLEGRLKLKTDPKGFVEDAVRSELKPGESVVVADGLGEALSKMVDEGMVKIGGVAS